MPTVRDFPEAASALRGFNASAVRVAPDGMLILSAAVPVQRYKQVLGALMLTRDNRAIAASLREVRYDVMVIAAAALGITVLLSLYLAGTITQPIVRLARAADEVRLARESRPEIPDLGKRGDETPEELEADAALKARIERLRLAIAPGMNLGDVSKKTVPNMCLVSPPQHGGTIHTRTFIPHRVHEAIGVLGAVSVATACVTPGSVAAQVAGLTPRAGTQRLEIEHPTGFFTVEMDVALEGNTVTVKRSALLRTARKLMQGQVFVPASAWSDT